MSKIKLIADSACDIPLELEAKIPFLTIINLRIAMNGTEYRDRTEITSQKIFDAVAAGAELPRHAHATPLEYLEQFAAAAREGYSDLICIAINSQGSGGYDASLQAKKLFPEEYPELAGKINIRCVDSHTYALGIGMGILLAAERIKNGATADEIYDFLVDHYDNQTTVIGLYALGYAKKSGRLSSTAAFVGDVLGLKPYMYVAGENKVIDKVRGDKNLAPRMAEFYASDAVDLDLEYGIAYGDDVARAHELAEAIQKAGGKPPYCIFPIGSAIAINSGPKMVGFAYRSKNHHVKKA